MKFPLLRFLRPSSPEERFRVESVEGDFRLVVPVRREGYRVLLDAVWLSLLAAFGVALCLGLAGRAPPGMTPGFLTRTAIVLCLVLAILGGAVLAWRILWMAWGREEFVVGSQFTIHRKIGRIAFASRSFPTEEVRNPRAASLRYRIFYPVWGRTFLDHEEHQIVFDVNRWTFEAARGLTQSDAERLSDLLSEALEARKRAWRAAS